MSKPATSTVVPVHSPPRWVPLWFAVSTLIVFWDASYCLLRPRSFKGGDLHHFWAPYALYQVTDLVYGVEAHARGEGFAAAQSVMNLAENAINLAYLALWRRGSPIAPLVGLIGAGQTCGKTILYWLMDALHTGPNGLGWGQTGHNTRFDWWLLFALPNSLWIIVPGLIVFLFAYEIAGKLRQPSKIKTH